MTHSYAHVTVDLQQTKNKNQENRTTTSLYNNP